MPQSTFQAILGYTENYLKTKKSTSTPEEDLGLGLIPSTYMKVYTACISSPRGPDLSKPKAHVVHMHIKSKSKGKKYTCIMHI